MLGMVVEGGLVLVGVQILEEMVDMLLGVLVDFLLVVARSAHSLLDDFDFFFAPGDDGGLDMGVEGLLMFGEGGLGDDVVGEVEGLGVGHVGFHMRYMNRICYNFKCIRFLTRGSPAAGSPALRSPARRTFRSRCSAAGT